MVIDVLTNEGVLWMRYESNVLPRVGETVLTLKPWQKEFIVLSIGHLIDLHTFSDEWYQRLVTITVKEK